MQKGKELIEDGEKEIERQGQQTLRHRTDETENLTEKMTGQREIKDEESFLDKKERKKDVWLAQNWGENLKFDLSLTLSPV